MRVSRSHVSHFAKYEKHPAQVNNFNNFFDRGWQDKNSVQTWAPVGTLFIKNISDLRDNKIKFFISYNKSRCSLYKYAKKVGVQLTTAKLCEGKIKVFLKHGSYAEFLQAHKIRNPRRANS